MSFQPLSVGELGSVIEEREIQHLVAERASGVGDTSQRPAVRRARQAPAELANVLTAANALAEVDFA